MLSPEMFKSLKPVRIPSFPMTVPIQQSRSVDDALQQALAHHQAGRMRDAEQCYRAILKVDPNHPDANHNLGVLAGQAGQAAAGLPHLKAALEANPAQGQYWLSYATALLASGQARQALDIIRRAIQRGLKTEAAQALWKKAEAAARHAPNEGKTPTAAECKQIAVLFNSGQHAALESHARWLLSQYPDSGFVWKALGVALQMQGKDAVPALEKAVQFLPDDAEAHNNLGFVLQERGQLDAAAASCRRALQIEPGYAEAHNNLGIALRDLGQLDDAFASYRQALAIRPDYAEAHTNLGNALQDIGQFDAAAASYRRALQIQPNLATAHNNLGNVLKVLGQLDAAEASCRRALALKPDYAEAHNNLGNALKELGRLDEAAASYRRALEFKSAYAEAHSNLGNTLLDLGQLDGAALSHRRAVECKPDCAKMHSNLLYADNFLVDQPQASQLAAAQCFGALVAHKARPFTTWNNVPEPDRCLRVGLVSGDFCDHPVGHFVEGMLANLASNASGRLEIIAYHCHSGVDQITERIKASCHEWYSAVGISDADLARRIRDDGVDILIDLAGHTAHNCLPLFAWKPAPVQVTWLGYLATTGVAAIDYVFADAWTLPDTEEKYFTEKIWRLPDSYLCFTPPASCAEVSPLPALSNTYITFGSFNNLIKINDAVVALWAKVLAAVPRSRLFLKSRQLKDASVRNSILERFARQGVDRERLILEGTVARAEYLTPFQRVDIALDPFPYPGITTSVENLWMGVPVLTLAGKSFLSRQGIGLLMNAGLPEWIADDADDYVSRAVSHASDLPSLSLLRNGLRQQVRASPIMDAPRFARHFEAALRGMWTDWCFRDAGPGSHDPDYRERNS